MNKQIAIFGKLGKRTIIRCDAVTHIESRGKWTIIHFISGKADRMELPVESVALRLWDVHLPQESD